MDKYKILIVIFLVFTLVMGVKIHQYKMEDQEEKQRFINHFFHSVSETKYKVDVLLEKKPKNEELQKGLIELDTEMDEMMYFLGRGNYLSSEKVNNVYINGDFYYMNGMELTINGNESIIIKPFDEDNKLDEKEVVYLKEIQKILHRIEEELASEDGLKIKEDLSYEEFGRIIEELYDDNHHFEKIFLEEK